MFLPSFYGEWMHMLYLTDPSKRHQLLRYCRRVDTDFPERVYTELHRHRARKLSEETVEPLTDRQLVRRAKKGGDDTLYWTAYALFFFSISTITLNSWTHWSNPIFYGLLGFDLLGLITLSIFLLINRRQTYAVVRAMRNDTLVLVPEPLVQKLEELLELDRVQLAKLLAEDRVELAGITQFYELSLREDIGEERKALLAAHVDKQLSLLAAVALERYKATSLGQRIDTLLELEEGQE